MSAFFISDICLQLIEYQRRGAPFTGSRYTGSSLEQLFITSSTTDIMAAVETHEITMTKINNIIISSIFNIKSRVTKGRYV